MIQETNMILACYYPQLSFCRHQCCSFFFSSSFFFLLVILLLHTTFYMIQSTNQKDREMIRIIKWRQLKEKKYIYYYYFLSSLFFLLHTINADQHLLSFATNENTHTSCHDKARVSSYYFLFLIPHTHKSDDS